MFLFNNLMDVKDLLKGCTCVKLICVHSSSELSLIGKASTLPVEYAGSNPAVLFATQLL